MYDLDTNTCTPADVIQRSITCHPTLLAEALRNTRGVHVEYASRTANRDAARVASSMADKLHEACEHVYADDLGAILSDLGMMVQVYTEACRLQLLPHHLRSQIMGRVHPGAA